MKEIYVSNFKIRQLWREFSRKRFAMPEIQREFVWDAKKACALLDSIYKKLPIGAVLIWDTDGHNHALLRQSLHILPPFNLRNRRIWFLIDGQQRLSVLHQVREGQQVVNSNGKKVDFRRLHFVFDDSAPVIMDVNAKKLAEALAPSVARKRPERWTRFLGPNPRPEDTRKQLAAEIRQAFGQVEDIVSEMGVSVVFKGVTYETLTNEKFRELAQNGFPHLRLMDEYEAAPQSAQTEVKR